MLLRSNRHHAPVSGQKPPIANPEASKNTNGWRKNECRGAAIDSVLVARAPSMINRQKVFNPGIQKSVPYRTQPCKIYLSLCRDNLKNQYPSTILIDHGHISTKRRPRKHEHRPKRRTFSKQTINSRSYRVAPIV